MSNIQTEVSALVHKHHKELGLIEVSHADYPALVDSIESELRSKRFASRRGRHGVTFSGHLVVPHKDTAYDGPAIFKSEEALEAEDEAQAKAKAEAEAAENAKAAGEDREKEAEADLELESQA